MRCLFLTAATLLSLALIGDQVEARDFPSPSDVGRAINDHFADARHYHQGGIISKSDVEGLFAQLARIGWSVADREEILDATLADDDFLVRELRTPAGEKFSKRIGEYPEAFDQLYRLSQLKDGKRIVRDLVGAKGGYELIEYMTTAKGGKNLSKMLARTPRGKRFEKPLERIFTVDDLKRHLAQSYKTAAKARQTTQ